MMRRDRGSAVGDPTKRFVARAAIVAALLSVLTTVACSSDSGSPTPDPRTIVLAVRTGPNNLDPRQGNDETSARVSQLIFNALVGWGDDLRVKPELAERLANPDPL